MVNLQSQHLSEDDVLITGQLFLRPPRLSRLQTEVQVLRALGQQLAQPPQTLLKHLAAIALEVCQAGTAGVSLIEASPSGEEVFRLVALSGAYERYGGGTIHRDFSPCGACLRRGGPQLYAYPERYFTYLRQFTPTIVESLVVPLMLDNRALGTIWILSHDEQLQFDEEDLRVMTSLADFAAVAFSSAQTRQVAFEMWQREQAARSEAEKANRLQDEFLAVLSHELRSPLNPILMWSKLLRSCQFDRETSNRGLETIERNVALQTRLVDDLLDVSQIQQGKFSLHFSSVNLAVIIRAALEIVEMAALAKSIQIQLKLDENTGLVWGDAVRLQQVVWNLLSNAVKFTPASGRVEVILKCFGAQAQIQVSDTGKGINSDFLPYVFERFRQADSATTRTYGGLGLGLSIVRHLVELHQGTVQAESPGEGLGATFTINLPLITP